MMHAGARAFSGDWTWRRVAVTAQSPPRETYWWQGDQHLRVNSRAFLSSTLSRVGVGITSNLLRFMDRYWNIQGLISWNQSENLCKLNMSLSLPITENLKKNVNVTTQHFIWKHRQNHLLKKNWEVCKTSNSCTDPEIPTTLRLPWSC